MVFPKLSDKATWLFLQKTLRMAPELRCWLCLGVWLSPRNPWHPHSPAAETLGFRMAGAEMRSWWYEVGTSQMFAVAALPAPVPSFLETSPGNIVDGLPSKCQFFALQMSASRNSSIVPWISWQNDAKCTAQQKHSAQLRHFLHNLLRWCSSAVLLTRNGAAGADLHGMVFFVLSGPHSAWKQMWVHCNTDGSGACSTDNLHVFWPVLHCLSLKHPSSSASHKARQQEAWPLQHGRPLRQVPIWVFFYVTANKMEKWTLVDVDWCGCHWKWLILLMNVDDLIDNWCYLMPILLLLKDSKLGSIQYSHRNHLELLLFLQQTWQNVLCNDGPSGPYSEPKASHFSAGRRATCRSWWFQSCGVSRWILCTCRYRKDYKGKRHIANEWHSWIY